MLSWIRTGLASGIKTTPYPDRPDPSPGTGPGFPAGGACDSDQARALVAACPTGALLEAAGGVAVEPRRCVHCFRCVRAVDRPLAWKPGWEWAARRAPADPSHLLGSPFRHSASVLIVDAGDCGACLREVRQLNSPYYNMHRLGIFLTPTPRHADILLVVGAVTAAMETALCKAYEAMPTPRCVVAAGACALTGGVLGATFACHGGVSEVLPVDVEVPGHPPPPLAVLHGLLVALGRKSWVEGAP